MAVSEGIVVAGLWDVVECEARQSDSAGGPECSGCNGGVTSLGANGHFDKAGLGIASWVLRDFLKVRHAKLKD
jgi:hypothetical protein